MRRWCTVGNGEMEFGKAGERSQVFPNPQLCCRSVGASKKGCWRARAKFSTLMGVNSWVPSQTTK